MKLTSPSRVRKWLSVQVARVGDVREGLAVGVALVVAEVIGVVLPVGGPACGARVVDGLADYVGLVFG